MLQLSRVPECQSSGVPHLVTHRQRRWAVRSDVCNTWQASGRRTAQDWKEYLTPLCTETARQVCQDLRASARLGIWVIGEPLAPAPAARVGHQRFVRADEVVTLIEGLTTQPVPVGMLLLEQVDRTICGGKIPTHMGLMAHVRCQRRPKEHFSPQTSLNHDVSVHGRVHPAAPWEKCARPSRQCLVCCL